MGNKQSATQESNRPQSSSHSHPNQSGAPSLTVHSSRAPFSLPRMGNAVKKHVDMAEKTGACQLAKQGLNEFPEELTRLTRNLRTLDLSENKIVAIPSTLSHFSMLKSLHLSHNQLRSLPDEIGQLKKLETLLVNNNHLTVLPNTISNLKSLVTLDVSANRFVAFPVQIYPLRNLGVVNLSANKITSVPDGINEIQAIEINLNQNQISVLSEDIASCARLKVLRLEENCLEKHMITPKILKHSQIAVLSIDGNLFPSKDFPHFDGYEEVVNPAVSINDYHTTLDSGEMPGTSLAAAVIISQQELLATSSSIKRDLQLPRRKWADEVS